MRKNRKWVTVTAPPGFEPDGNAELPYERPPFWAKIHLAPSAPPVERVILSDRFFCCNWHYLAESKSYVPCFYHEGLSCEFAHKADTVCTVWQALLAVSPFTHYEPQLLVLTAGALSEKHGLKDRFGLYGLKIKAGRRGLSKFGRVWCELGAKFEAPGYDPSKSITRREVFNVACNLWSVRFEAPVPENLFAD